MTCAREARGSTRATPELIWRYIPSSRDTRVPDLWARREIEIPTARLFRWMAVPPVLLPLETFRGSAH
eukprot:170434-Prymnesium_polylepis.1